MKCPLCGCEFSESATTQCRRCPLHGDCQLVCCPNCGYQWPQDSRVVSWLKRAFRVAENATRRASSHLNGRGRAAEVRRTGSIQQPHLGLLRKGMQRLLGRGLPGMFRHRPLGPDAAPEVLRAFDVQLPHPAPDRRELPAGEVRLRDVPVVRPLTDLRAGEVAQVVSVSSDTESRLHRLGSLGVVPGSAIELQQKHPSFVVKVDETLLAMDRDVASRIYVVPAG